MGDDKGKQRAGMGDNKGKQEVAKGDNKRKHEEGDAQHVATVGPPRQVTVRGSGFGRKTTVTIATNTEWPTMQSAAEKWTTMTSAFDHVEEKNSW